MFEKEKEELMTGRQHEFRDTDNSQMKLSDFESIKTLILNSLKKRIDSEEGHRDDVGLGLGNMYALKELHNTELTY